MVERRVGDKVLRLVRGDITDMEVEAFVHDITTDGKLGSGFGGAIQQRGGIVIQKELDELAPIGTGEAVVTGAGILKATSIIHVNGPKFREQDEEEKLGRSVRAALAQAEERGIRQVAFPPLGTGLYQVPLDLCVRVMVDTICRELENGTALEEVLIVAPDAREFGPFEARIQEGV